MNSYNSISHSLFLSVSSVHGLCILGVHGRGVQHRIPRDLCMRPSNQCLDIRQSSTRRSRTIENRITEVRIFSHMYHKGIFPNVFFLVGFLTNSKKSHNPEVWTAVPDLQGSRCSICYGPRAFRGPALLLKHFLQE